MTIQVSMIHCMMIVMICKFTSVISSHNFFQEPEHNKIGDYPSERLTQKTKYDRIHCGSKRGAELSKEGELKEPRRRNWVTSKVSVDYRELEWSPADEGCE